MRKEKKKEYNIIKAMRDRFLFQKSKGFDDATALSRTATELRVPESEVQQELERYGYSPQIGGYADVPVYTPSFGGREGRITVSEDVKIPGTDVLIERGEEIRVVSGKKNRSFRKREGRKEEEYAERLKQKLDDPNFQTMVDDDTIVISNPYAESYVFVSYTTDGWMLSLPDDTEYYPTLGEVAEAIHEAFRRGDLN